MRRLQASVAFVAVVGALAGCPAIVGLDGSYSAGGSDGGSLEDGSMDGKSEANLGGGGKGGSAGSRGAGGSGGSGGTSSSGGSGGTGGSGGSGGSGPMCPPTCALAAPAGWTLVAYVAAGAEKCPSGFTEADVVEPSGGGTCTCSGCAVTTQPDCYPPYPATISSMWNLSGGSACDGTGGYFITNGGACVAPAFGNATYQSFMAPGPTPGSGACTSSASGTGPTTASERVCTPTGCPTDACESSLGSSFATCLYKGGDETCPGAAPNKHKVGSSASVSCGGCDCSVSATGCAGKLSIFESMTSCPGIPALVANTDGTCYAMPPGTNDSYTYAATPTGVTCNAGDSTATVNISGQGTVCCP